MYKKLSSIVNAYRMGKKEGVDRELLYALLMGKFNNNLHLVSICYSLAMAECVLLDSDLDYIDGLYDSMCMSDVA